MGVVVYVRYVQACLIVGCVFLFRGGMVSLNWMIWHFFFCLKFLSYVHVVSPTCFITTSLTSIFDLYGMFVFIMPTILVMYFIIKDVLRE